MPTTPVTRTVTLNIANGLEITGVLEHDELSQTLTITDAEGVEWLSTNLEGYGLLPRQHCVFIKDWSEHKGLATALVDAHVGEIVGTVQVGPFTSTAYEVRITV